MKKITVVLFLMGIVSCKTEAPKIYKNTSSGPALGTSYNIIYLANKELDFKKEIDSVFTVVNKSMSTYMPSSDISKINKGDTTVVVDVMFKDVFKLSNEVYTATNGYFDPTVGALANAWGFGPGKQVKLDSAMVDSILQYVGFSKVSITNANTVKKLYPNIYFDFNAVAKGYTLDCLAKFLDKKNIDNYLIELGGEIVAKGQNTIKQKPWLVGVDDPEGENRSSPKVLLNIKDKALASSGNYRKFRIDEVTGEKYVHTINPKTGYTKNSSILGTTVIANTCATADAYATSFMAMDLPESKQLLSKNNELEAFIIYVDEKGKTQQFMTDGFKKMVVK